MGQNREAGLTEVVATDSFVATVDAFLQTLHQRLNTQGNMQSLNHQLDAWVATSATRAGIQTGLNLLHECAKSPWKLGKLRADEKLLLGAFLYNIRRLPLETTAPQGEVGETLTDVLTLPKLAKPLALEDGTEAQAPADSETPKTLEQSLRLEMEKVGIKSLAVPRFSGRVRWSTENPEPSSPGEAFPRG